MQIDSNEVDKQPNRKSSSRIFHGLWITPGNL